jgi:hypothetical protein
MFANFGSHLRSMRLSAIKKNKWDMCLSNSLVYLRVLCQKQAQLHIDTNLYGISALILKLKHLRRSYHLSECYRLWHLI